MSIEKGYDHPFNIDYATVKTILCRILKFSTLIPCRGALKSDFLNEERHGIFFRVGGRFKSLHSKKHKSCTAKSRRGRSLNNDFLKLPQGGVFWCGLSPKSKFCLIL